MRYLRVTAEQAAALRGKYGEWYALDPVPLADSDDYILTDAVLSEPAFADALDALEKLDEYPQWQPDTVYGSGDIRQHDGRLWRIVQPHTSQAGWEPPNVPALWMTAHRSGVIPEWQQPSGAHDAYPAGYQVVHNGQVWESTVDNNVWEPGVFGWELVE